MLVINNNSHRFHLSLLSIYNQQQQFNNDDDNSTLTTMQRHNNNNLTMQYACGTNQRVRA